MRLLRVQAKNVFSLPDIELVLANRGLLLIAGENGVGKSSIANKSIVWGLYGSTIGGLSADDVVSRNTDPKESYVVVDFYGVDGKVYQVKRSRLPKAELTLLSITDGKNLTRRQQAETQDIINKLLGRDLTAFAQADFMGQGRAQNFLSLAPGPQKEILEQILPIRYLAEWAKSAKGFKSELEKSKVKLINTSSRLEGALHESKNQFKRLSDSSYRWEEEHKGHVSDCEKAIRDFETNLAPLRRDLDIKKRQLEKVRVSEEEMQKAVRDLGIVRNHLAKAEERETYLRNQVASIKMGLAELTVFSDPVANSPLCPTCGQVMPEDFRAKYIASQKHTATVRANHTKELNTVERELGSLSTEKESLVEDKDKAEKKLAELNDRYHRRSVLSSEICHTMNRINDSGLDTYKAKLEMLNDLSNPYDEQIESAKRKITTLEAKISKMHSSIDEFASEIDHLSFWVAAFTKDFRFFMLDKACPFLTGRVSAHLERLGNPQIHAVFSTQKELKSGEKKSEFNVEIFSDDGAKGFDSLSGGEQQILSFAVSLALADLAETQVGGTSSVMILDEPFVYLDGKNSENLVNYLMTSRRETTLLISNDDNLKSLVPNIIRVTKDEAGCTSVS